MHWEVEQKFRLTDAAAIEGKLVAMTVPIGPAIRQIDRYFNHPARDFGKTDEALRIRQVGNDCFITYKGPRIDPATKTRRELEIRLFAGSSGEDFAEFLLALGFRDVATVKKTRRTGILAWQGFSIEIVLDEVDQLGSFVELEIVASDSNLGDAKNALASLSQHLNPGPSERRSYLELLLREAS